MKKSNIVDLIIYRDSRDALRSAENPNTLNSPSSSVSTELETAIQLLIFQLRNLGPIKT